MSDEKEENDDVYCVNVICRNCGMRTNCVYIPKGITVEQQPCPYCFCKCLVREL
jgi:hypothetical protein